MVRDTVYMSMDNMGHDKGWGTVRVADEASLCWWRPINGLYKVTRRLQKHVRAQELCESRDGRPGLPSLIN